jgi:hypothetical protein
LTFLDVDDVDFDVVVEFEFIVLDLDFEFTKFVEVTGLDDFKTLLFCSCG